MSGSAPPGGRFEAFASVNFRLFFIGQTVAFSGTWMQRVAQAWLVLDLSDSPTTLGLVIALQFLPAALLIPVAGVVADRMPKRRIMRIIQAGTVVQATLLAALSITHTAELWHVYVLAVALGCFYAFDQTTRMSYVGEMVDRERLQSAVSLTTMISNLARIVGPSIAGVIIALAGVGWCFLINALFQMFGMAMYAAIGASPRQVDAIPRADARRQLMDGLRYARGDPRLLLPLLLQAVVGVCLLNWQVVLPLLARYALDVGSVGLGLMSGAQGAGAVLGSLIAAGTGLPRPRRLVQSGILFALGLAALGVAPTVAATMVLLVAVGALQVTFMAASQTTLQLNARDDYRGRVLSLSALAISGSTPVGATIIGALADLWSIRVALVIAGAISVTGIWLSWLSQRASLREDHDRP